MTEYGFNPFSDSIKLRQNLSAFKKIERYTPSGTATEIDIQNPILYLNEASIASPVFDGIIPKTQKTSLLWSVVDGQATLAVKIGGMIRLYDNDSASYVWHTVTDIIIDSPAASSNPEDVLTPNHIIVTFLGDGIDGSMRYDNPESTYVTTASESWEDKSVGTAGWILSSEGNSIFNNVAIRGEIEATSLSINSNEAGDETTTGIYWTGDPEEPLYIGADVNILGTVTAEALTLNEYNYWTPTLTGADFRVGGATSGILWDGTTFEIKGDLVTGTIGASSGGINGWNISQGLFASGATTNYVALSASPSNVYSIWAGGETASTAPFSVKRDGTLKATSANITGAINATSGTFTGDVKVDTGGKLYVGSSPTSGQRVVVSDTGITGVDNLGITVFNLPATGSTPPTITNFNVLEAKITGEGANAYLIAGTTGVSANNVIVRGDKTGGQAAAIYSTISGTTTTATTGNGFYFDDTGKFRFAQGSNVISGSGGNLSVTGQINATSGYIGGSSSGWLINSNILTNDSGIYGAGLISTSSPILQKNLAQDPDLSYGGEPNTFSNSITGYNSINDFGTFYNNNFETGYAVAPHGYTMGAIKINTSTVTTSIYFTGSSGSNTITATALLQTDTLYPGMYVYGTGIASGATIVSVFGDVVQLSAVNTGAVSGTITFLNPYSFTKTVTGTSGGTTITVSPNNFGITTGMRVTGTGIRANVIVVSIAGNVITLSASNTGAVSGTATFFTENNPLINHFGGFDFTTADIPYTFTPQTYVASAYFYIGSASSSMAGRTVSLSVESGSNWTNGASTPATLVVGSWVRASRVITMVTAGSGSPNIVARLSGASNSQTDYKVISTSSWMITEGSTLQSYFDETFPMGVGVGGYAVKYEQAFYSGTTYANRDNASLQLGHGGNIYASTGKIGGLNVNSNRLYATTGKGDFVVGDIGTLGDYPEYGLRIDYENFWSQTSLEYKKNYTNSFSFPGVFFSIDTASGYFGFGADDFSTISGFNTAFSGGFEGTINLGNVEDADNDGLYNNVSVITSNYYGLDGISDGSTYIAQFTPTTWIMGPNVTIANDATVSNRLDVNGTIVKLFGVYSRTSTAASNMLIATNPYAEIFRSTASSQRWKNSIENLGGDLEASKILDLPVRQFKFNNDYLNEEDKRFDTFVPGFVAEEVAQYYPIAAEMGEDGEVDDWNVRMIIPPMLKLIQDQEKEIKNLKIRLDAIENK
jgi:hypothetical protein